MISSQHAVARQTIYFVLSSNWMLDPYRSVIFIESAGGDSAAAEYSGRRLPKERASTVSLPNVSHIYVLCMSDG